MMKRMFLLAVMSGSMMTVMAQNNPYIVKTKDRTYKIAIK